MDLYLLYRKAVNKYIHLLFNPVNKIYLKLNKVSYGRGLKTKGKLYIMRHYGTAKIFIGENVSINSAGWANPIGCGNKTCFQTLDNAEVIIGDNCGISNTAFTCAEKIELGNDVLLGSGCHIFDTDFHALDYKERIKGNYPGAPIKSAPIKIDDGVFIGAGSYILKGVHIGKHSIIGAGSVVTKDVPSYEIWAGNPAHFLKKIKEDK
ncbi:MAG: acyltransferase [Prevotellaceae bacterium]|nr:acyltransferase [Prevotellaceae bacterium]